MSGLRALLRIARRDVMRARGRSALVLLMIALPVIGIVAVDVLIRTVDVSVVESLDRRLGAADALVQSRADGEPVEQDFEMKNLSSSGREGAPTRSAPHEEQLVAALPTGTRLVALPAGPIRLKTERGQIQALAEQLDLGDPVTVGMVELLAGRAPAAPGEIAVTERLAARGLRPGATTRTEDGRELRVVATLRGASTEERRVLAAPGTLDLPAASRWLVDAPGPVTWEQVRRLNALGALALSRDVVVNRPPRSELSAAVRSSGGTDAAWAAIVGLVVAMALLQVVLLAGPAFAVGARRQRRSLALLAATGGEPRHLRVVVLAGGLVLGVAASLLGVVVGLGVAFVAQGPAQRLSTNRFGPFEVRLVDVVVIAAFGAASAVLAALAPALSAARQDVVAVLGGRRGQAATSKAMPALGLALIALGVAGSVFGATRSAGGELVIALATVGTVVGAVLLCPSVLGLAGTLARRLPLPARFAVRDAARQRGRTAPAVAAIMATVAGVVALGIAGSSDGAERRATYVPQVPLGWGLLSGPGEAGAGTAAGWGQAETVLRRELPDADVRAVRGLAYPRGMPSGAPEVMLTACYRGGEGGCRRVESSYASGLNTNVPVGSDVLDLVAVGWPAGRLQDARRALEAGGVVVFAGRAPTTDQVVLRKSEVTFDPQGVGRPQSVGTWTLPVAWVQPPSAAAPAQMILSEQAARTMGIAPEVTALVARGATISREAEDRVQEALGEESGFYVERGQPARDERLLLLLLAAAGGVLVLGGTLTATLLALAEARPDFATLAAVGAAPAMRRRVATAYAAALGLLGTVLGTLVGLVPGIAAAFPLTSRGWRGPVTQGEQIEAVAQLPSVFIDVPWLLLAGLTVGVPLVAALGVALFTRGTPVMIRREAG